MFRPSRTLFCFLAGVALLCGCASGTPLLRDESLLLVQRVRSSAIPEMFPTQYNDLLHTHGKGEAFREKGNSAAADEYFGFAITKAKLLESDFAEEIKSREEAALRDAELRARAEAEQKLKLERERAEAEAAAARAAAEAKAAARKAEAEQAEARRRTERARFEKEHSLPSRHTVKRGETLPQIAALAEVYGDASLWPLLYRANRDQIRDPRVLWPGQQLKIPRNLDKNDINEARRFSSERSFR